MVELFVITGQLLSTLLLARYRYAPASLLDPLIARVSHEHRRCLHKRLRLFVHAEVVNSTSASLRGENAFRICIDDYLRLDGVPLLLTGVVSALFFWGRSTGDSVQSMVSLVIVGLSSAWLRFGSAKRFDFTSAVSILRMILNAFDSLTP